MTRGFTLAELLVTLVVLGIMFALVAGAVAAIQADDPDGVPARLGAARVRATHSGESAVVRFSDGTIVTVFADGSATAATVRENGATWEVDPWTAEARRVAQ